MNIIIDGVQVEAAPGASVLETALAANLYIPHLCKHPDLEAVGGCRLCIVEVEGESAPVPACKTTVREGMQVHIHTARSDQLRNMAMELILASHPADCTGCPKYGKCELQSLYQYMGVGPERWKKRARTVPNDETNPLISHLFTRCIRCGRCVRACRELRGVGVLDFQRTKVGIRAGIDGDVSLAEAGCRFCGACIEVCPTGSIMDALGLIKEGVAYADSVVPCRSACPAGIDIPRYLRCIKDGDFSAATAVIRETVPFPEILGSVCNHACESECKRGQLNEPVSICRLKRTAAERDDGAWKQNARQDAPSGRQVAVIGAGPAGLTAAYYLRKKGHKVTVFEKQQKPGGQCRYGIPSYRLPDALLDREIDQVLAQGIDLQTGTAIEKPVELLTQGYDAVLVSIGTHKGNRIPIPGHTLDGVLTNTEFLRAVREGNPLTIGERVLVLGGGNVAYDCARTAVRLGAKEVHLACLEAVGSMPASQEEITEGAEEGVLLHGGYSFQRILGETRVAGMQLQPVKSLTFENGQPIVTLEEDGTLNIPVDTVIFAAGQKPEGTEEMGLSLQRGAYIQTDEKGQSSTPGVFAAGDVVTGTRSVIAAIAAGRESAKAIDRYLGGDGDISEQLAETATPSPYLGKCPGFARLERHTPPIAAPETRSASFSPVENCFCSEDAQREASRCLQCDLRLRLERPKLWNEYQKEGSVR